MGRYREYPKEVWVGINLCGQPEIVRDLPGFWDHFRSQKPARYRLTKDKNVPASHPSKKAKKETKTLPEINDHTSAYFPSDTLLKTKPKARRLSEAIGMASPTKTLPEILETKPTKYI